MCVYIHTNKHINMLSFSLASARRRRPETQGSKGARGCCLPSPPIFLSVCCFVCFMDFINLCFWFGLFLTNTIISGFWFLAVCFCWDGSFASVYFTCTEISLEFFGSCHVLLIVLYILLSYAQFAHNFIRWRVNTHCRFAAHVIQSSSSYLTQVDNL